MISSVTPTSNVLRSPSASDNNGCPAETSSAANRTTANRQRRPLEIVSAVAASVTWLGDEVIDGSWLGL
jgi:hypothetical protein